MRERSSPDVLNSRKLRTYVERFSAHGYVWDGQAITDKAAADWMERNIPLFECPDKAIEEIYHFRWWTFRKHLKATPAGFVITEFRPNVSWSGAYNAISCPLGHHFYEGRWISDLRYLDDYARFWTYGRGEPRRYSSWLADGILARSSVTGRRQLARDLLPGLITNYEAWEASHLDPRGLFWQEDDRDGMEISISGGLSPDHTGYRATINSYLYGDAQAIATIASWDGQDAIISQYNKKASSIRQHVLEMLWDPAAQFFKVMPRIEPAALSDVRELHGFTPWYFDLPPQGAGYEAAWKQLLDPQGFYAPYGPTTAEQRHPGFRLSYEGHACQWNGPSWPFSTSVTLTAMANLLNTAPAAPVSRADYFKLLQTYTRAHRLTREDGSVVPWIDENLHPYTGDWISRSIHKMSHNGNGNEKDEERERGENYNHSTYVDLIISGLVGLRPRADDGIEINPLLPDNTWDFFCLDRINYHDHLLTIIWDRTGKRYGKGEGLTVWVDGKAAAQSDRLTRITGVLN